MAIGSIFTLVNKLFLSLLVSVVLCSCVAAVKNEPSAYGFLIHAALTGDMIKSGKKSNTPTIQNTICRLHLFINPAGGAVEIDSRLSKYKNYNGANDLRSLGNTYKIKFRRGDSGTIKKEKIIPCDGVSQWFVSDLDQQASYRLYFSWLGYRNGYKELDADRGYAGFGKELLIGKAQEKIIIMSVTNSVEEDSTSK